MPFYGKGREGNKALNSKKKQRINSLHFPGVQLFYI